MPHLPRLLVVTPVMTRTGASGEPLAPPVRMTALGNALRDRALVEVVQRGLADDALESDGVRYRVVLDGSARVPAWRDGLPRLVHAVKSAAPDTVLVDGLEFPALVAALRDALGPRVPIVLAARAHEPPPAGDGWMGGMARRRWSIGLDHADAVAFASDAQRARWIEAGLLRDARRLPPMPRADAAPTLTRDEARARTGLTGTPLVLWLGAYTPDDDPAIALAAFEAFRLTHPDARLAMAGQPGPLEDDVRAAVHRSLVLQLATRILAPTPQEAMRDYLHAAHIVLCTHRANGGPDLREALAAGLIPVTPSHQAVLDVPAGIGATWTAGDARDCAAALARAWASGGEAACEAVRAHVGAADAWRGFSDGLLDIVDSAMHQRSR